MQNIRLVPSEIARVSRERIKWIACGSQQIVVSTAPIAPDHCTGSVSGLMARDLKSDSLRHRDTDHATGAHTHTSFGR
jgi:hypothetical protein